MRRQFRIRTLLLTVTAVAVFLSLVSTLAPVAVWVGRYQLTIQLRATSPEKITNVWYAAYSRRDVAEWLANEADSRYDAEFKRASLRGRDYVADIRCSGRRSLFGTDLTYTELRFVVVWVRTANGETRHVVEVPEGRGPRTVSISVEKGNAWCRERPE